MQCELTHTTFSVFQQLEEDMEEESERRAEAEQSDSADELQSQRFVAHVPVPSQKEVKFHSLIKYSRT